MLSGNVALAKLLIESGANVSAEDSEGERPIHFAAAEDQADLIIELANGGNLFCGKLFHKVLFL